MSEPKPHWLVRPRTIRRLWVAFGLVLAATVVAGLLVPAHVEFGLGPGFAFFAVYGFLVCVAQIAVARLLALLLKRRDTYYHE